MIRKELSVDAIRQNLVYAWLKGLTTANTFDGKVDPYGPVNVPNLVEITAGDYWFYQMSYSPMCTVHLDYAQRENGQWSTRVAAVYGDGHHIARGGFIVEQYNDKDHTVKYWSWASCLHEYKHTLLGNCYHGYNCVKCGASYTVDSSD